MSCEIDGYNECETTTRPRARKEHRCCACKETIRRGDIYERTFFVWEHEAHVVKRCLRCAKLYDILVDLHRDDPFSDQGVAYELDCGHDWDEVFSGPPPEDVARLAFMTPDEQQREFAP